MDSQRDRRIDLLSDEELDALRPMEEAVDKLLEQSIGLVEFVEDLEEIQQSRANLSAVHSAVRSQIKSENRESMRINASAILRKEDPNDAELRLVERFAPTLDASALRNLIELSVLFGVLAGAEYALNGRIGSFGVHPHPYWILVLPMAASRGILSGLMAAGIATILFTIGAAQALQVERITDLLTYKTMQEPLRFAFAAFFVGQFRDALATRYRALWRRFMHLQEATEHILGYNAVLSEANESYKTRLLDHGAQFGNLIEIARRQEKATARDIFEMTLEMIEEHCCASLCSVLLPVGGSSPEETDYELAAHRGWNERFLREKLKESAESQIVRDGREQGIRLNSLDPHSKLLPGLGPLMVAPLFDESRAVCALVCLDQLPADRLSKSTASVFFGIADWAEASLLQIAGGHTEEIPEAPMELRRRPWLGSPAEFGQYVRVEDARCTRVGLVSSMLGVRAKSKLGRDSDAFESMDRAILGSLGAQVRNTDAMFRFGYPGCYAILLPGTDEEGVEVIRERVEKWLGYTADDELEEFEVTAFHPDEDAPDLRSLLDRMAAHFRAGSELALDHRCPVTVPERFRLGNLSEFVRRMRLEMGLARRNKFDLFLIHLTIDDGVDLGLESFPGHVEDYVQRTLRATDGVFQLADDRFAILLPGSTTSGAFGCAAGMEVALKVHLPEESQYRLQAQVFAAHGGNEEMDHLIRSLLSEQAKDPENPVEVWG